MINFQDWQNSNSATKSAGNGTEWEAKTLEWSSSPSGGDQWAHPNFLDFIAVQRTKQNKEKALLDLLNLDSIMKNLPK